MVVKFDLINNFKKIDVFGTSPIINYKGETKYKTIPGACFSVFILVFILYSLYFKLFRLYSIENQEFINVET
jgi:hypothetical protein